MDITLKQFFSRFTTDEFPPAHVFASTQDGSVVTIPLADIPSVITRYSYGGMTGVSEGSLPILVPIV